MPDEAMTRRTWLGQSLACTAGCVAGATANAGASADGSSRDRAQVAITLDLEMSRNFPQWEDTHWDYQKGNLNEPTKEYTVNACRRVKSAGGVIHSFCVGRVLEQEEIGWLLEMAADGHPIGNHTYDHVNVKAKRLEDVQFRFQRSPWLVEGRSPAEIIEQNVRLTNLALRQRAGVQAHGFRTPGGFNNGLEDRPDVQEMLLRQGFAWVSSKYASHPVGEPGIRPTPAMLDEIVAAQAQSQPFVYPSGLVEVPMSPISDISAFRGGRWKLEWFLEALGLAIDWCIDNRAAFDFLAHPSCLYVVDPEFRAIDFILDRVSRAGERAEVVDLTALAARAKASA